jgi:hypothetical protein
MGPPFARVMTWGRLLQAWGNRKRWDGLSAGGTCDQGREDRCGRRELEARPAYRQRQRISARSITLGLYPGVALWRCMRRDLSPILVSSKSATRHAPSSAITADLAFRAFFFAPRRSRPAHPGAQGASSRRTPRRLGHQWPDRGLFHDAVAQVRQADQPRTNWGGRVRWASARSSLAAHQASRQQSNRTMAEAKPRHRRIADRTSTLRDHASLAP